ncbi:putative transcriptional regulatory protein C417.09c-like protein 1 [Colletotrichum chlorophyti]|uniref:Putative transcriptional regulatory protein C417.09c-like protein 1 n=1 Tax=Colletotrichum chlorophyti TaxID=708187 RepID=A0A1Q8RTW0_9PEZI|nr:putative transcriptional regulatory protein C417.09c-like protein 1 [Colletotrichum chlorophyti]
MDAEIRTPTVGISDNASSGSLKRKRRPRAPIACGTCRARKVKVGIRRELDNYEQRVDDSLDTPKGALTEQLHPSPVSLDEPIKNEYASHVMSQDVTEHHRDSSATSEQEVDGLGRVNEHTEGAEFYGPTGTFYFLARLRSRANTQKQPLVGAPKKQTSVVNLLHSSDYSTPPDSRCLGQAYQGSTPQSTGTRRESLQQGSNPYHGLSAADVAFATELERECVRLYFQNLHNIHPILEQISFIKRCEDDIWGKQQRPEATPSSQNWMRRESRFLSLFNIVAAIGAITAGETSLLMEDHTREFLDRTEQSGENETTYPPIRLARRFFERSRFHLEDICESSSLETAQTLFLMSVFGQNALKPHSCYMYSGMAIRTASAMGIPTNIRSETSQESLLWWLVSSSRIKGFEMCSSAGRQSGLRAPNSYSIPFPKTSVRKHHFRENAMVWLADTHEKHFPNSAYCLINPMVDLAKILIWMTDNLSLHSNHTSLQRLSQTALNLDRELDEWKSGLPRQLRFEMSSLEDSEFAMKQKTVLKLHPVDAHEKLSLTYGAGFLNARILLHRQFIIQKTQEADRNTVSQHVTTCVKAATETIKFMHTNYLHRPYFRTWWYNCMYLLDASMVLLHVLISNNCLSPPQELMEYIDLSLDIFRAMKMLAVARRCADIVRELLSVAAKTHRPTSTAAETEPAIKFPDDGFLVHTSPAFMTEDMSFQRGDELGEAMIPGDFDANLVDPNVVWNFLNFEHWNAWSDAGFR